MKNELAIAKAANWLAVLTLLVLAAGVLSGDFGSADDPGVRGGTPGAGGPLPGLNAGQLAFFEAGKEAFDEANSVFGEDRIPNTDGGLGPSFNMDSCGGCHAQPATGGTSPAVNPQVAVATKEGANNRVPSFVLLNGPVREARFKRKPDGSPDGEVHDLFVISGRRDAPKGCDITQTDFRSQLDRGNVIFRIPTPTFGLGLIEMITDAEIQRNRSSNSSAKQALGISGRPNNNAADATLTRFGWKAQQKSLQLFSGEAYNVEQGVTNELFPNAREAGNGCDGLPHPEDGTEFTAAGQFDETGGDIPLFAGFMRLLAPPMPVPSYQISGGPTVSGSSINRGKQLFYQVGCVLCHTETLRTGSSAIAALSNKPVNLFSDLLLHDMGTGLADDIAQGAATGREFRTAPLWGLGQRIFFLHDGRTKDLVEAIKAHSSSGSEARETVENFFKLDRSDEQHVLNFLRSL